MTVVFSKLIFMNQVTKPTSNRAGERKQVLFQPGRIELSSFSLLNPCLRQGTAPYKKSPFSLSSFGSCSGPENPKPQLTGKV